MNVIPVDLGARGYTVTVLPVYRTVPASPDTATVARVQSGAVDAVTFTSSSTVDNFCAAVVPLPHPQPLVVSIGPVTSATAVGRGLRVDAEAAEHTIDGLVATLLAALAS
jgi:uroporphyrinogen III methyltransferase/synthase